MAIGSGSTLPLLTFSSTSASAGSVLAAVMPIAIVAIIRSGLRIDFMSSRFSYGCHGLQAKHLSWIKGDADVGPNVLLACGDLQPNDVAFLHSADGTFVELAISIRLFNAWPAIEL